MRIRNLDGVDIEVNHTVEELKRGSAYWQWKLSPQRHGYIEEF